MKLLFDHNLSPRLVKHLIDLYPDSTHVVTLGLGSAPDRVIWDIASEQGYTIVTKDADFSERSLLLGFPPKVVWIRRGNCSTRDIETLLRDHHEIIRVMHPNDQLGVVTLF